MGLVGVTEQYLMDIADAIRGKNGSQDTYTPAEMADAIEDIPTGGTIVDGDNLGFGDATVPLVGAGQAGYAVI